MSKTALVIDDEPDIRELLSMTLEQMGLDVTTAAGISKAKKHLTNKTFDLCLTDMKLPDGNGLELVDHIQEHYPNMPVAVITAHGNMEIAVEALKKGAFDFVSKPLELMRLRNMVQTALDLQEDHELLESPETSTGLIGSSPAMQELQRKIQRVARSQAPIFINGESGSGNLRDRAEDIEELAQHLLKNMAQTADEKTPKISTQALKALLNYDFPGNVRELENILERAYTLCANDLIDVDDLQLGAARSSNLNTLQALAPAHDIDADSIHNIDEYLAGIEKDIIEKALESTRWNRTAAAEKLGLSFRQMRYKLKKLGLE
jgi:DNA-binding NtrC family response regulator